MSAACIKLDKTRPARPAYLQMPQAVPNPDSSTKCQHSLNCQGPTSETFLPRGKVIFEMKSTPFNQKLAGLVKSCLKAEGEKEKEKEKKLCI